MTQIRSCGNEFVCFQLKDEATTGGTVFFGGWSQSKNNSEIQLPLSPPIFLTFQRTCTLADNVVSAVPVVASSFNWKHTNSFPQGLIYVIVDCTNSYFFAVLTNFCPTYLTGKWAYHTTQVCTVRYTLSVQVFRWQKHQLLLIYPSRCTRDSQKPKTCPSVLQIKDLCRKKYKKGIF